MNTPFVHTVQNWGKKDGERPWIWGGSRPLLTTATTLWEPGVRGDGAEAPGGKGVYRLPISSSNFCTPRIRLHFPVRHSSQKLHLPICAKTRKTTLPSMHPQKQVTSETTSQHALGPQTPIHELHLPAHSGLGCRLHRTLQEVLTLRTKLIPKVSTPQHN